MSRRNRQRTTAQKRKEVLRPETKLAEPGENGQVVWLPQRVSGVRVTEHNALTYSAVFACIKVISEDLAKLPFRARRNRAGGQGSDLAADSVQDWLLHIEANPETSAFQWREVMVAWALSWGNGYAEIERDAAGRPLWLWQLTPDRVDPARDSRGRLVYDVANPGGPNTVLPAEDVFHLKGPGFDGLVGYSVIALAARAIGIGLALDLETASSAENESTPGGLLRYPHRLTKEARDNLQRSWTQRHQGLGRRRTVGILEEGMEWIQTGLPAKDMEVLNSRQFQPEEICRFFRVPPHKIASLMRATFCVPGDAAVFTENGPRPASEVQAGERVWSRSSEGQWVLSRVERSGCTGLGEIVEIRAGIRTLRCTANHRLPVRRASLTPFVGGKGQTLTVDGKKYRRSWEVVWVEAGDVRPGDQLLAANGLPDTGVRSCPTREECSVEFMEALGMIVGDGYFARTRGKYKTTFGISHGDGADYLPHYVAAIESEFMAGSGPYAMRNGGRTALKAKVRDKNTTSFNSTPAYAELSHLGITGTSRTKQVPAWVFGLSDDLKLAFLRGYLDADGTVNKHGYIRYVSANHTLLEQVRHLCVSVGVRVGNLFSSEIDSTLRGKKYRHTLWGFLCTNVDDCRRIGTHTRIYRDRWDSWVARRRPRVCKTHPYEQRRRAQEEEIIYTRVESVCRKPGLVLVYDLTVEGTHTFLCESVLVHNSNIEHQGIDYYNDAMLPWGRRLECEADRKLFGRTNRGTMFTKINFNGLLRGDSASRADFFTKMIDRGIFSINDVLELEDMNPIGPDGDKRFVPVNMQLLEQVGLEKPEETDLADTGAGNLLTRVAVDVGAGKMTIGAAKVLVRVSFPGMTVEDFDAFFAELEKAPAPAPEPSAEESPASEEETPAPGEGLAAAMLPVLTDAWARIRRREAHRVKDALGRIGHNTEQYSAWLTEFAAEHRSYVLRTLNSPAVVLGKLLGVDVQTLLGLTADRHIAALLAESWLSPDGLPPDQWESTAPAEAEQLAKDIRLAATLERSTVANATG